MLRGRRLIVIMAAFLCFLVLSGCAVEDIDFDIDPDSSRSEVTFILIADGQVNVATSSDADNLADVLERAGIVLKDGDILSVKPDQVLSNGIVVEVLRSATVQISLSEDSSASTYTISLLGATVGDALRAVGIELSDILSSNFDVATPLFDGMQILVSSTVAAPAQEQASSSSSGDERSGGGRSGGSGSSGGGSSSSSSGPTIVSTERYDDCDGSGHGVMVITYSDGTQVERPY